MAAQQKLLPRTKLLPGNEGPPIRRDAFHDDEPAFDDENVADDDSHIFERLALIQMSHTAYDFMMDYLTSHPPERAVALIGPKEHDAVTHVLIDEHGESTPASHTFGHVLMNGKLKVFIAAGLDVKGIGHTHPFGVTWPSHGDLVYVEKCFAADKHGTLDRFLLPIICGQRLYPYVVFRDQPLVAEPAQVILF
jgi:hypothetical protein